MMEIEWGWSVLYFRVSLTKIKNQIVYLSITNIPFSVRKLYPSYQKT